MHIGIDMENDILKEEGKAVDFGVWKFSGESKTILNAKKSVR